MNPNYNTSVDLLLHEGGTCMALSQVLNNKLKIVQVISNVPNARTLPPTNQGGTEKIVYELTEELVKRNHDVYLFAAKGSKSRAKLITYPKHLRDHTIGDFVLKNLPRGVHVIHDHTFRSAVGRKNPRIPTVCTLHLPVKQIIKNPVYVSRRARTIMGKGRGYYVYNGINPNEYEYNDHKYGYLLFMGRIMREKGILHALNIADKTNKKLVIAGPIKDSYLYRTKIAPRIRQNPNISYVGAVGGKKKQELLKNASCLLFPTIWEEPFGLVMIEAMACGTPVLALRNGSVPEILSKFPGLICHSVQDMIQKVRVGRYPKPKALRQYVIQRFTTAKMASDYLRLYNKIRFNR
jgi:glycosyltransferase involved in cell wall biosynthesis